MTGNRLSRRRARTANAPLSALVSATAAAIGRLRRLVHPQRAADPDDPRHVGGPLGHPVHRRRVLAPAVAAVAGHPQHQHALAQQ